MMECTLLQALSMQGISFFAIDNVDFAEDTPNGKRTLHGAVMAIYQRHNPEDRTPDLQLTGEAQAKTLKKLPSTITDLLPCRMPKSPKPKSPSYPAFTLNEHQPGSGYKRDVVWLLGQALLNLAAFKEQQADADQVETMCPEAANHIPTWSAYNSLVSTTVTHMCQYTTIDSCTSS